MRGVTRWSDRRASRTALAVALPLAGLIWTAGCGDDGNGGGDDGGSAGDVAGRGGAGSGGTSGGGTAGGTSAGRAGSGAASQGEAGSGGTTERPDAGAGGRDDEGSTDAGSGGTAEGGAPSTSTCSVTPPDEYDASSFDANTRGTTDIQRLVEAWSALVSAANLPTPGLMTIAEVPVSTVPAPVPPNAAALNAAFTTGSPSLSSVASPTFRTLAGNLFAEHAEASAATWDGTPEQWNHAAAPANQGGVWHRQAAGMTARLFNERAVETRTLLSLGSYAGVFYNYAVSLLDGDVTPATIDVMARAFGVEVAALPVAPDSVPMGSYVRTASYAHSVGMMAPAKDALIRAQAYAADAGCTAERDLAIADLLGAWEAAAFARVVYYANQADVRALAAPDGAAAQFAYHDALHQLAEAAALAAGFQGVSPRVIEDAQLAAILAQLQHAGLPSLSGVNAYALVGNDVPALTAALAAIRAALLDIEEIYGFSAAQMANFKSATPTPG